MSYLILPYPVISDTILYHLIILSYIISHYLTSTHMIFYHITLDSTQLRKEKIDVDEINFSINKLQQDIAVESALIAKNILLQHRNANDKKKNSESLTRRLELQRQLNGARISLISRQEKKKTTFLAFSPAIDISVLRQVIVVRSLEINDFSFVMMLCCKKLF